MPKMRNAKFKETNELFSLCCQLAKTEPTTRQAAKFRNGRGYAFRFKAEVIREGLLKKGIIQKGGENG